MTTGTALYDRLTGHAGTAALISTRCYRLRMPDNPTMPALVLQRISSSGQSGTSEVRTSRWQVSCWATTSAGAEALATQVRAALEEWSGGSSDIKMVVVVSELEDYDDDSELYRVIVDALLTLKE